MAVDKIDRECAAIRDLSAEGVQSFSMAGGSPENGWRLARTNLRIFGVEAPGAASVLIGSCAAASDGFRVIEENLELPAGIICERWPALFPTERDAIPFERQAVKLACKLYEGEGGNQQRGDGYNFRGRGYLMDRGLDRYTRLSERLGLQLVARPDDLALSDTAWRAAAVRLLKRAPGRDRMRLVDLAAAGDLEPAARALVSPAKTAEALVLSRRALTILK